MKTGRLALLLILLLVQLAVPFYLIRGREAVLERGTPFRFMTQPIDPVDPFQGRFIWLRFEADHVPMDEGAAEEIGYDARGFALIGVDEDGFARFEGWSWERPPSGDYLKTRSQGVARQWNQEAKGPRVLGLRIELPFSRFYMQESKAPAAERIALDRDREEDCWALVRVHRGTAVIEDVLVGGRPISDLAGR